MPGSGIVGKEMKYKLTEEQNALAGRIRLMKTMFTDSDACDTIAMESMALVKSMEKELVKSLHRNAIIPPGADKFWRTTIYVKGENGSLIRRNLRASTEEKLYGKLYNHYVGPGTLEQMYELWARYRKDHENLAAATTLREKQRWDKYFGGSELSAMRADEITNFQIEDHLYAVIKKDSITAKELREIRFLLRKTFNYALRHNFIQSNPMDKIEVNTTGCAPAAPKYSESRVFFEDEVAAMQEEIDREVICIPWNTTALAVSLLFLLGLRVGEIVALRLSDIDFKEKTVHIQRMEQREENGPVVVNHTKKKSPWGNRTLALGDMGLSIVRQIIAINEKYGFADEDYLFLGDKGKRIHIRAVDNRIRKLCGRAGIEPAKSAHDIRRTVATKIYRSTKDIELVRKYLGHSDVQTTWGYIIDIESERENREKVVDALSGFFSRPSEKNSDPSGKISYIRKRFAKKQPSALQEDGALQAGKSTLHLLRGTEEAQ